MAGFIIITYRIVLSMQGGVGRWVKMVTRVLVGINIKVVGKY